jgi:branched-chain amino acid transport system ATP-binding protein
MMLTVDDVSTGYGRIPILSGISFHVREHEAIGFLGHNGMGKTTLLKALIGHLPLTRGSLSFLGADIGRQPAFMRARAGLGYVPQGRAIFPSLTVYENLHMGCLCSASAEERTVGEVIRRLPRLRPLLDRPGKALSGGEQQILALARCLCGGPKLLLLDEPTEGIQPSIVDEILDILIDLRRQEGLAMIVVEQNLAFIRRLADRILRIEKGSIVDQIPTEGDTLTQTATAQCMSSGSLQ